MQHLSNSQAGQVEPLDTGDIAEACGWLTLSPARLHRFGRVRRAAAELVPCFLEAVADQALVLRALCGTAGVAHCVQGCFDLCRVRQDDCALLSCDKASLCRGA